MKIVVNRCFGGFGLSDKAIEMIMNRKGLNCFRYKQTKYEFESGKDEYERCEEFDRDNLFTLYYTEDLGKKIDSLLNKGYWQERNLKRNDADLIAVVEKLGEEANGRFAELKIVEIPDDIEWYIDDYDGNETIHEVHRSW